MAWTLVLLVLLSPAAAPLAAQDGGSTPAGVRGRVLDGGGGPVPGARVRLIGPEGEEAALTDRGGRYVLAGVEAGRYTLRVEALGYRAAELRVRVQPGAEERVEVTLHPAPVDLGEVVVSAARTSAPLASLPGAVSVLGEAEVAEQAQLSRSLGDMLGKVVPGFSAGVESPSLWGQSLRGRNVAVLIDGVPQSTTRNVSRDLSTIDPSAIERIEVIRGATAVYGNGATGGVINIVTHRPAGGEARFTTELGSEMSLSRVGEGVGTRVRQAVSGGFGALDYVLGGSLHRTGGFFDAQGDRISPDPTGQGGLSDTETGDLFAKLGLSFGEQRVQLLANHFDSRQLTEFAVDPSVARLPVGEVKSRTLPGLDMDDPQGSRNTVLSLDYRHADLGGSRVHGQLFFRDYLTRFAPYDGRKARTLGHQFIQSYLDSRSVGGRLEVETPLGAGRGPTLLWGVDLAAERTSQPVGLIDGAEYDRSGGLRFRRVGEAIWVPAMEPRSLGVFGQLSWSPVERLTLRGGVRHERIGMHVDDFVTLAGDAIQGGRLDFDPVLYNLGAVVDLTGALSLFGGFSQGFSTTDIGLFLRSAPAGFRVGNKTLEPQLVNHVELGMRGAAPLARWSLSGFYNQSDLGTSSAGFDMNVVRAPERVYGVEGTLDLSPAPSLDLGGTLSWVEGEFDPEGDGSYRALNGWRIQPMKLTAYLEHRTLPRWSNRLQALYSGSRDRAYRERPDRARVGFGERPVQSFVVVDWIGSLRLGGGALQVGVQNLLNAQYFPVAAQLIRSGNNLTYTPARGAALTLGYTVSY